MNWHAKMTRGITNYILIEAAEAMTNSQHWRRAPQTEHRRTPTQQTSELPPSLPTRHVANSPAHYLMSNLGDRCVLHDDRLARGGSLSDRLTFCSLPHPSFSSLRFSPRGLMTFTRMQTHTRINHLRLSFLTATKYEKEKENEEEKNAGICVTKEQAA